MAKNNGTESKTLSETQKEKKMIQRLFKKVRRVSQRTESGMVSAEYALGTVASTGIAGILIWLSKQDWLRELIANIFRSLLGI